MPIALVLVALWAGRAYINAPDEPPLVISMCVSENRVEKCSTAKTAMLRSRLDHSCGFALVLVAMCAGRAHVNAPDEPPLVIIMCALLLVVVVGFHHQG